MEEKYFYKLSDKYYLYSAILISVGLILGIMNYRLFFVLIAGIILLISKVVMKEQFVEIDKNGIRTNKFSLKWKDVEFIIRPARFTTRTGVIFNNTRIITKDKTYVVLIDGSDKMMTAIRRYYKGKIESYWKK